MTESKINTEPPKASNEQQSKRIFSIFKNNKTPTIQIVPTIQPRVIFHFGTGAKFPAYTDPNQPFTASLYQIPKKT